MRNITIVAALILLLTALTAGTGLAEYTCEYSNSEGTGNDATNRTVSIAVLSEDNFVMAINRADLDSFALCKWTDANAFTGRGNNVLQWSYDLDTVNLEEPFGTAADGNGYVYVANNDPNHNILVFDANGPDPVATPYRLETATDDTIYAIDLDSDGHVYLCYCNADQDRVDIYPSIMDTMWASHTGSPMATVLLPDGLYYGMCVNTAGTEIYVSEYTSATVHRYIGSVSGGFTLDSGFSVEVDSLASAIDIDNQGYLYVVSDHWQVTTYEYSWFWVVYMATGAVTDKIDMFTEGGGVPYPPTPTTAGYYSAIDVELDGEGNLYVVHYYAWAVEKWAGAPTDSTAPEAINDLAIALESEFKVTSGDIYLWWTKPSDNLGVTRYVVYRNTSVTSLGDSLAGIADTTYTDMDAAGDVETNYFYAVKAVDAAGNKSEESNKVGEFDRSLITGE